MPTTQPTNPTWQDTRPTPSEKSNWNTGNVGGIKSPTKEADTRIGVPKGT